MEEVFREKGLRLTPQRQAIMKLLHQNPQHFTAEEVYEQVRGTCRGMNLATVYRNLHLLNDLGLLRRLDFGDGRNRYEGNMEHHHHLICLECGQIWDLSQCPLQPHFEQGGFLIKNHTFTAYGVCHPCQDERR